MHNIGMRQIKRPIALTIAFFRHCQRYDTHRHIRHLCQNARLLLQRERHIAKAGDSTRDITLPPPFQRGIGKALRGKRIAHSRRSKADTHYAITVFLGLNRRVQPFQIGQPKGPKKGPKAQMHNSDRWLFAPIICQHIHSL